MIKRYCDSCGTEIEKSATSDRIIVKGARVAHKSKHTVQVEVTCGVDETWNGGDLCVGCVIDAVNRADTRPRAGVGLAS